MAPASHDNYVHLVYALALLPSKLEPITSHLEQKLKHLEPKMKQLEPTLE